MEFCILKCLSEYKCTCHLFSESVILLAICKVSKLATVAMLRYKHTLDTCCTIGYLRNYSIGNYTVHFEKCEIQKIYI